MNIHSLSIQYIYKYMARSQAPLSLEYILLGFICQGPIHGYDLYKKISNLNDIALFWHIKQSLLYALLEKLEGDGLLTSSMVPGKAHLIRKEYQITSVGRQTFLTWMSCPVSRGREIRQEFMAKLYFAHQTSVEASMELIDEQKTECEEWLASQQNSFSKTSDEQRYERMIYQFRISQTQATMEWLEYCRIEIQNSCLQHSGVE